MKKNITIVLCFISTMLFAQKTQEVTIAFPELNDLLNVRDVCLSNNGNECYFTMQSPNQTISVIATMKKVKGIWLQPQLLNFTKEFSDLEPHLSPNNLRLYFASNRPLNDTSKSAKDYDIWYVQRTEIDSPWQKPINIGSPVNTAFDEFYPCITTNENLYFTSERKTGLGYDDIYVSKQNGNNFSEPILLDTTINTKVMEFNSFVSRDERFMIFTKYNTKDGYGSGDLFITYKTENGTWGLPQNLGNTINTKAMEYCPFYDEVKKVLYFTSRRNTIQPKQFNNFRALKNYISTQPNGLSKIYKISIPF